MTKKQWTLIAATIAIAVILMVWWGRANEPYVPTDIELQKLLTLSDTDRLYIDALNNGIASGGPPKDGIPAVDNPQYEQAADANGWLSDDDVVFGVLDGDRALAYPQRILVWHEIVNDNLRGGPVSITYCPLTGTAIGYFAANPAANDPTFGVSGKLVNSNLIMYDRESDSLWPQILGQAIRGVKLGERLEEFPIAWTTWAKWKAAYPNTEVLSKNTGVIRNYEPGGDPYGEYGQEPSGYYSDRSIIFPPVNESDALPPKQVVVGVRDGERNAAAVLKKHLRSAGQVTFDLGGRKITLTYVPELDSHTASYTDIDEWINSFDVMWFAWYGYYPDTQLIIE